MTPENELPAGWIVTTLSEIREDGTQGIEPRKYPEKQFELYSVPSHPTGQPERIKGIEIGSNKVIVYPNTVLLCKINPRINRVWVVGHDSGLRQIASTEWIAFSPKQGIYPKYLSYYLQQSGVRDYLAAHASGVGGSLMRVKPATLKDYPFRLAPFNEQRRIIERVEELLSDLDAGVSALERARANLKKYRAAVLKAAVTGELTADWRAAHPHAEPASKLLDRILAERRRQWEATQQAKFAATGKTPPKGWQAKYPEPVQPDTTDLPELPPGWCWARLDQLISYLRNGYFQSPVPLDFGVPLLRINAVRPMRVDLSEFRYLPPAEGLSDYLIENGDLLFTRYNGSLDLLGVAGMVRGCYEPIAHPDKLIRVKAVVPTPLPNYLEVACNTGESRRHMASRARTTAGQTGISGGDIKDMPIPLPPLAEQAVIISEVEERLSVIAATENYIAASLKRAGRLRQSILKEAFAGRLVPQDPTDEPAAALLERIRSKPSKPVGPVRSRPVRRQPRRRETREVILRRGAMASYIVNRLSSNPSFGRTQLAKALHLSQDYVGIDLAFTFRRHPLGPLDEVLYKVEGFARKQGWFKSQNRKTIGVTYQPGPHIEDQCRAAEAIIGDKRPEMDRMLAHLSSMNTDQAELFSTVFAAWNDLLIDNKPADDDAIVRAVYDWHESKRRFSRDDILARIAWMRENGYIPTGTGTHSQPLPDKDDGTAP